MLSSVGLNERSCEIVQRYSVGKHATDVRSCSAGKKFGDITFNLSI